MQIPSCETYTMMVRTVEECHCFYLLSYQPNGWMTIYMKKIIGGRWTLKCLLKNWIIGRCLPSVLQSHGQMTNQKMNLGSGRNYPCWERGILTNRIAYF